MADREQNWSREDVAKRMDFALRCAFAHGTGALRTHIDSYPKQTPISWPLFAEMREQWKGRIALQAVALFPIDFALTTRPNSASLVETVAKHGGVLGGLTFSAKRRPADRRDARQDLRGCGANGLDLDFHVDESDSPDARSLGRSPRRAAPQVQRRIVAGHCCSLALAGDAERAATIAKLAEAGDRGRVAADVQHVPAGPRSGRTPRWRGVAPLHELEAARRHRDGRERQHARSVLRLWRTST
jgi:cytosine deaminase